MQFFIASRWAAIKAKYSRSVSNDFSYLKLTELLYCKIHRNNAKNVDSYSLELKDNKLDLIRILATNDEDLCSLIASTRREE